MSGHPPWDNIDQRMSVREAGMQGEDGGSHGPLSTQVVLTEGSEEFQESYVTVVISHD